MVNSNKRSDRFFDCEQRYSIFEEGGFIGFTLGTEHVEENKPGERPNLRAICS